MVASWLARWMVSANPDPVGTGKAIAQHFNDASKHKSHGRRIDRDEAAKTGVVVEHLEDDQKLQEGVLIVYHLLTIMFGATLCSKVLYSDTGRTWLENVNLPVRHSQPWQGRERLGAQRGHASGGEMPWLRSCSLCPELH